MLCLMIAFAVTGMLAFISVRKYLSEVFLQQLYKKVMMGFYLASSSGQNVTSPAQSSHNRAFPLHSALIDQL